MSYFLNPKTEVRVSRIGGKGLFAKEGIKKGEVIHISDGIILAKEQTKEFAEGDLGFCYQVDDASMTCPKDFKNPTADWYINHSCEPNVGVGEDYRYLVAMKDIAKDEEITYDYAMTEADEEFSMPCMCGARNCRKTIKGNDWMREDLRRKYGSCFSSYIKVKISRLKT